MANQINPSGPGNVVHARISRRMTLADQRALEACAKKLIDEHHQARLLVTLEAFEGWEKDEAWADDLDFQFRYGNEIARIAIVGNEEWKESALAFVGKGFRSTDIEFFPTEAREAAEAWVQR